MVQGSFKGRTRLCVFLPRQRSLQLNPGATVKGLEDGSRPFPLCFAFSDWLRGQSSGGRSARATAAAGKEQKPLGSQLLGEVGPSFSLVVFLAFRGNG